MMASSSLSAAFRVGCPGCPFEACGTRLGNARRALRGHALRVHRALFDAERHRLLPLGAEELAGRQKAFRRGQQNSRQRRASRLASGDGGSPERAVPGCRAGPARTGDRPPDPMPDLSAGQLVGDDDLGSLPDIDLLGVDVHDLGVQAAVEFETRASQADLSLAGGRSPSEVADVLLDVAPRRRPSTIAGLLGSPADDVLIWALQLAVEVQRRLGTRLADDVLDSLRVDPTGQQTYVLGLTRLRQWSTRPQDQ